MKIICIRLRTTRGIYEKNIGSIILLTILSTNSFAENAISSDVYVDDSSIINGNYSYNEHTNLSRSLQACHNYTSSYKNEAYCLQKSSYLSVRNIEECGNFTSSCSEEKNCLKRAART